MNVRLGQTMEMKMMDDQESRWLCDLYNYYLDCGMSTAEANRLVDEAMCTELIHRRKVRHGDPGPVTYDEVKKMMDELYA